MTVSLSLILPREKPLFSAALAPYFNEVMPSLTIDPGKRAAQMLHRKDVTAFWVLMDAKRVGFAIVLNLPDDRREFSEFAIFPQHRRNGLGQEAAQLLLHEFPGFWRMGISAYSKDAAAFWGTCLSTIPGLIELHEGAPFTEHQSKSYSFEIKGPEHD